MNSMAIEYSMRIAMGLVATMGLPNTGYSEMHQPPGQLIITAKPTAVRGACNSVRCPDIEYELVTTQIIANTLYPTATPSDVSVLRACGPSGLRLGSHYKFVLRDGTHTKRGMFNQPLAEDGKHLECKYVFREQETVPAPVFKRN